MIIYYSLGKLTVMYVMNDLKVYPESNSGLVLYLQNNKLWRCIFCQYEYLMTIALTTMILHRLLRLMTLIKFRVHFQLINR